MPKAESVVVRFLRRRILGQSHRHCWGWEGTTSKGYAKIKHNGEMVPASRVSFTHYKGPIPPGLSILHSCDNPICTNPYHLRAGTKEDNTQDAVKRGRTAKGSKHGNAILTEEKVLQLRADRANGMLVKDLMKKYGVAKQTVRFVYQRKLWRHI